MIRELQDVEKVIRDKEDIRKYLRRREERGDQNNRAVAIPRTVYTKRYEDPWFSRQKPALSCAFLHTEKFEEAVFFVNSGI